MLDLLKLVPTRSLTRRIQTIVGVVTKRNELYDVNVSDTNGNYTIPLNDTRFERAELLSVENFSYTEMIHRYQHLKGVKMEDTDRKSLLPARVILGASDYAKIKTREAQRTGPIGEPVAQYTRFGWAILSPGSEADLDSMFLAHPVTMNSCTGWKSLDLKTPLMETGMSSMLNSPNSSSAVLRDGMRQAFPGREIILPYQRTNQGA